MNNNINKIIIIENCTITFKTNISELEEDIKKNNVSHFHLVLDNSKIPNFNNEINENNENVVINPFSKLTPKQYEIIKLIILGKKTNKIAIQLNIKANTVSTVKKNVLNILKVDTIFDLINLAYKFKVISFL